MPKFRVLRGQHTEGKHSNSAPILYHGPRTIREKDKEDRIIPGDVVDSKADLLLLNKQESTKFAKVPEDTPTTYEGGQPLKTAGKASVSALAVAEVENDGLEELTVVKLKEIAAEEEIELDMSMRKDEIINSIRIARDLS